MVQSSDKPQHPSATSSSAPASSTKTKTKKTKKTTTAEAGKSKSTKKPSAKSSSKKHPRAAKRKRPAATTSRALSKKEKPTETNAARQLFGLPTSAPDSIQPLTKSLPNIPFTPPVTGGQRKAPQLHPKLSANRRKRARQKRQKRKLTTELATAKKHLAAATSSPAKLSDAASFSPADNNSTTSSTLQDFIAQQTADSKIQQDAFANAMTSVINSLNSNSHEKSSGYKLNTNPALQYKPNFPSQLEADVFFQDVDASIVASSSKGHAIFRDMLKLKNVHPFYTSARFKRLAPKYFGRNFVFDHTNHDDTLLIARLEHNAPSLAKHLRCLIQDGGNLSWEAKSGIIHQYYRATLPKDCLYYLTMRPENNGLALRQLMKEQSKTLQFNDSKLATISTAKIIRRIKYNKKTGLLKYFGLLTSEIGSLTGLGMTMEPGSFAEMDLIGHVFDHLSENNPILAAKITWIRSEIGVNRYDLTFEHVKKTLLQEERLHRALNGNQGNPIANNVKGNSKGNGRQPSNRGRGEKQQDQTPKPWLQTYSHAILQALVAYARMRYNTRLQQFGRTATQPEPNCLNCAPENSIHKRPRRYNGHTTEQCHTTLIRAYHGFTTTNSCKGHPDGCHIGSTCSQKANRAQPAVHQATPTTRTPATTDESAHHIAAMMALPVTMRAAYAAAILRK